MSNNPLVVCDTIISQDAEGRFCLNDLHKAAGNHVKNKPANWLQNQQTQDLIAELSNDGIPSLEQNQPVKIINGGNKPGTFVVKQLVYAYAMWISAKFHLHVINAYDALVTGQTFDFLKPITEPITPDDFKWRHQAISTAFQNLKNATVVATFNGSELLVGKRLVKSKRLF
jgi:hypothetical protein